MTTFQEFLCGTTTLDYVRQSAPYEQQIARASKVIEQATHVLIGAGAGMSTAAGAVYGGDFFEQNFGEFQKRYGRGPYMRDMYSAGFFPYPSQEAFWGYWSKQALAGGVNLDVTPLHRQLLELLADKDVFCLTTNADGQFQRAGLPAEKIFATQGDYFHIQCARGCHPKTYDAVELFRKMDGMRMNCEVPRELVPTCPVCGGPMTMNLRCDDTFVEDDAWHIAEARFGSFLDQALRPGNRLLLLELGVGFNTPTIIRFPFERLAARYDAAMLVRLNKGEAIVPEGISYKTVAIDCDIAQAIADLGEAGNC